MGALHRVKTLTFKCDGAGDGSRTHERNLGEGSSHWSQQIECKVRLIAGALASPDFPMNKQRDISRLASCAITIIDSLRHLRRPDGLNEAKPLQRAQNALGRPAWGRIALAVWRLGMPTGTAKFRFVIGLYQISWLPLPCRTKVQPAARSKSRSGRSNCGAIQARARSASRNAVIWMKTEFGSTSG